MNLSTSCLNIPTTACLLVVHLETQSLVNQKVENNIKGMAGNGAIQGESKGP